MGRDSDCATLDCLPLCQPGRRLGTTKPTTKALTGLGLGSARRQWKLELLSLHHRTGPRHTALTCPVHSMRCPKAQQRLCEARPGLGAVSRAVSVWLDTGLCTCRPVLLADGCPPFWKTSTPSTSEGLRAVGFEGSREEKRVSGSCQVSPATLPGR
jgi:hypothetical protein